MKPFRYYVRRCERCRGLGQIIRNKGYLVPCYLCGGEGEYVVAIDTLGNERRVQKNNR